VAVDGSLYKLHPHFKDRMIAAMNEMEPSKHSKLSNILDDLYYSNYVTICMHHMMHYYQMICFSILLEHIFPFVLHNCHKGTYHAVCI